MNTLNCLTFIALLLAPLTTLRATEQAPPDELTLSVGDVKNVGTDVTLVLKKRSVRSENYVVGTWSKADGFKRLEPFPVRTYRGFVKDKPVMRVNADIEPGGVLYANISVGRGIVASIEGFKINVPAGRTCTPLMSAGNKEVPVKATRVSPTPGGYLVPPQPMRRIEAIIQIDKGLIEDIGGDIETAVTQNEQRVNDADFVYARDIGVAWEVNTLVIRRDDSDIDFNKIKTDCPGRHGNLLVCAVGIHGKAHAWAGGTFKSGGMAPLSIAGLYRAAGGLAHEAGHKFRGIHNADEGGDCMGGGGDFIGSINGQLMIKYCEEGSADVFPGVIYNGALPPFLMDDVSNTMKDRPISIDVLANDFDGNGGQVFLQTVVPKSEKGCNVELSPDKKTVIYTPSPGFAGLDRFTYTAVNSIGIPNQTGRVKVDVRSTGLAYSFPLDKIENGKFADLGPFKIQGSQWALPLEFFKGVAGNAVYNPSLGGRGYIYFPDVSPPGRCSVSISLWVLYPDAESLTNEGVLITHGGCMAGLIEGGSRSGWGIGHLKGGKGFKFAGNVSQRPETSFDLRSEALIQPLKWYHLAVVFDRETKKMRAWVNSQEILKSDTTANIPEGVMDAVGGVYLFNGYAWKAGRSSRALLDEVQIYSNALTPEAVAALYAKGSKAVAPDFKNGMIKQPSPEGGRRRGR